MINEGGQKTNNPHDAVRFLATIKSNNPELENFTILLALHRDDSNSHLDLKTPNLANKQDFDEVYKLKKSLDENIDSREGLPVTWSQLNRTIKAKDLMMDELKESKDISKVYGHSLKSSYQKVGECKLIIRHSGAIDETKNGSRFRNIKNVFIENKLGERFAYPYIHVSGARAMARHISNGGIVNDEIAEAIKGLSHDYMGIKKARGMLRKAGLQSESDMLQSALRDVNSNVKKLAGPRGYAKMSPALAGNGQNVPNAGTDELHKKFLQDCNITDVDAPENDVLGTAARYIIRLQEPQTAPQAANDNTALADKLTNLASKTNDDTTAAELRNIAELMYAGDSPSKEQITFALEQVKNVSSLNRIEELAGLK
jgi:hypothetical protein